MSSGIIRTSAFIESKWLNRDILLSIPSAGDVGAMAVDCILATLSAISKSLAPLGDALVKREFTGDSDCLVPLCGFESYDGVLGESICMPIEGLN